MWATHRTLIFAAWHTLPIVRRSRFGFSDEVWLYSWGTGVWRSLVARFVRDEEAVGSNPATPTVNRRDRLVPAIFVCVQPDRLPARAQGRERGRGGWCGNRAARGDCGARGRAAGRPFGTREAAVPEGGGRAWPGFEPTRRAEGSRRGRRAGGPTPSGAESSWRGGPTPSGAESSWRGGPTPLSTEKGHQHCAVTIENGDPTHQQHGRQGPHERSNHVHNVEACVTNLSHVINFQCIHSYDI